MAYERIVSLSSELCEELGAGCDGDRRLILHFGAVDQIAVVFVNGIEVGSHEGGYLPFSFDITEAALSTHEQYKDCLDSIDIRVEALDTLDHKYPWGKQKSDNGGMWYTPVSGIWQSVWLEVVPKLHIESLKVDTGLTWVEVRAYGIESGILTLLGKDYLMGKDEGECSASVHIEVDNPRLWTPEDPYLYEFSIRSGSAGGLAPVSGGCVDLVTSYFGMRTLTVEDADGYRRLCLNGKPYFFNGLLDQGYWQDGIYTPKSPSAYQGDILAMKSLGFNTLRKHIKIEPEQFYYDCDRLGMVVFQDMVNNGEYSFLRDTALPTAGIKNRSDKKLNRDPRVREIFLEAMDETVRTLYNHPSICYWTIFNEGWGQFDADGAYERLRAIDSSRFIDSTSGWFWQSKTDVDSHHVYFKRLDLRAGDKPLVLSEFGGYACKLPEHCYNKEKTYGYRKCENEAALLGDMAELYEKQVLPLVDKGLCAAIYTQVSDVEDETNGILTYDREILKFKSYVGTGRIEILGNHTDHQGGRVMVAPSPHKIRAYVAENHGRTIRVKSVGFEPVELSLAAAPADESDKVVIAGIQKGTTKALVQGILAGFAELFGQISDAEGGIDIHVKSEVPVGSGLSSSAAFEVLIARIINERYYGCRASDIDIARISMLAEQNYYGKPCGMMDQLAIAIGRPAMLDFGGKDVEIEPIGEDLACFESMLADYGIGTEIHVTGDSHDGKAEEFASIPGDMFKVAGALGISRLGDFNEEQFKRRLPELDEKVKAGELTELQLNRAKHFYAESERVLAGAVALKTGNIEKFLQCVNLSCHSSETLLRNIVPEGTLDNELAREIRHLRGLDDTLAVKLIGGGFGGSVLAFVKK